MRYLYRQQYLPRKWLFNCFSLSSTIEEKFTLECRFQFAMAGSKSLRVSVRKGEERKKMGNNCACLQPSHRFPLLRHKFESLFLIYVEVEVLPKFFPLFGAKQKVGKQIIFYGEFPNSRHCIDKLFVVPRSR